MASAFKVVKIYPHSAGLSCCFRQWRAQSHCRFLHGYSLQIELTFEADILTDEGWVIDFGSLKPIREYLEQNFDHKLLVAEDDPLRDALVAIGHMGGADVVIVPYVGCEAFASQIFNTVMLWTHTNTGGRVRLSQVIVKEHEANAVVHTA